MGRGKRARKGAKMPKTKWINSTQSAAFARLCNYCKKHNEVAQAETKRRAKIAWIAREIEKFDDSRLSRIVILVKQIKD